MVVFLQISNESFRELVEVVVGSMLTLLRVKEVAAELIGFVLRSVFEMEAVEEL